MRAERARGSEWDGEIVSDSRDSSTQWQKRTQALSGFLLGGVPETINVHSHSLGDLVSQVMGALRAIVGFCLWLTGELGW